MTHDGIVINVPTTLEKVQGALAMAKKENNIPLKNAAESVLSALTLVLRRKNAMIPTEMGKHLHTIDQHVPKEHSGGKG